MRTKVAAALRDLEREFASLENLVAKSIQKTAGAGRPGKAEIAPVQREAITEFAFLGMFRAYEAFIEDVFILYVVEKNAANGKLSKSYVKTKNREHARDLIKQDRRYLDWASPDTVLWRSEMFLKNGGHIKPTYTTRRVGLMEMRDIRNHVAHRSVESRARFRKVLRSVLGTEPMPTPTVGGFLLLADPIDPSRHIFDRYLEELKDVAILVARP